MRGDRKLIPEHLQEKALDIAHEGHQGIVRTKQSFRKSVWFPKIDDKVEEMINTCLPCKSTKVQEQREPIHPNPMPNAPWEHISVDYYGPT